MDTLRRRPEKELSASRRRIVRPENSPPARRRFYILIFLDRVTDDFSAGLLCNSSCLAACKRGLSLVSARWVSRPAVRRQLSKISPRPIMQASAGRSSPRCLSAECVVDRERVRFGPSIAVLRLSCCLTASIMIAACNMIDNQIFFRSRERLEKRICQASVNYLIPAGRKSLKCWQAGRS
jgi:hypothetical protein